MFRELVALSLYVSLVYMFYFTVCPTFLGIFSPLFLFLTLFPEIIVVCEDDSRRVFLDRLVVLLFFFVLFFFARALLSLLLSVIICA